MAKEDIIYLNRDEETGIRFKTDYGILQFETTPFDPIGLVVQLAGGKPLPPHEIEVIDGARAFYLSPEQVDLLKDTLDEARQVFNHHNGIEYDDEVERYISDELADLLERGFAIGGSSELLLSANPKCRNKVVIKIYRGQ